jgi:diguanylate cyclase
MNLIPPLTPNPRPFTGFEEAVQAVLQLLHTHVGFNLWMFTRVEGDDWIVMSVCDRTYGIQPGDVFHGWDLYCSRRVCELGPRIIPTIRNLVFKPPCSLQDQVSIGTYMGVPIYNTNGSLFGTLCAFDSLSTPSDIQGYLPFIELQARLLTTILSAELAAQEQQRHLERIKTEAHIDVLTGLYNRRAWNYFLKLENDRCQQYGASASVIVMDLDDLKLTNDRYGHLAGDRLLQRAGQVLSTTLGDKDILARLGGDEFSVLMVGATSDETEQRVAQMRSALEQAQIAASLGWAIRSPTQDLETTFERADRYMYQQKMARKSMMCRINVTHF